MRTGSSRFQRLGNRLAVALVPLCVLMVVSVADGGPAVAERGPVASRPVVLAADFEALVDRYLCEVRGVGCSVPGGMSAESFQRRIETQQRLLGDLEQIDRASLTLEQETDFRFLEGILKANIREGQEVQRWRQDPRRYLFTNGMIFKIQADPRHPDDRGRGLIRDLQGLRAGLEQGRENLTEYIPNWLLYSNARIDGTIIVMQEHVPDFAARLDPAIGQELLAEAESTIEALRDFRVFVNDEWTERPEGDFKIGADLYNYLHENRHQFPAADRELEQISAGERGFTRVPDYHDWGWKQYEIAEHHLEAKAASMDPTKTWLEIIRETKSLHPFNEQLVYEGIVLSRRTREWTIANDLVSIPWGRRRPAHGGVGSQHVVVAVVGLRPRLPARREHVEENGLAHHPHPAGVGPGRCRGEPDGEGLELLLRDRTARGLSRAPLDAAVPEPQRATATAIRVELLQPGLVLLHRVGADPEAGVRFLSRPSCGTATSSRSCGSSCGAWGA